MSARLVATPFPGFAAPAPALVERRPEGDARGAFARLFCRETLQAAGWPGPVAAVNHSLTRKAGTVRGLHYQRPPHAEAKLVTCLRGAVLDVALDIRPGSPTQYRHAAAELSAENGRAMFLPEGYAHGFQALTDEVELLYVHSAAFAPEAQAGLRPDDPALAIAWPLPIALLSQRDAAWPLVAREKA